MSERGSLGINEAAPEEFLTKQPRAGTGLCVQGTVRLVRNTKHRQEQTERPQVPWRDAGRGGQRGQQETRTAEHRAGHKPGFCHHRPGFPNEERLAALGVLPKPEVASTVATRIWRGLEAGKGRGGFEQGRRCRLSVGALAEGWAGGPERGTMMGGRRGARRRLSLPS